MLRQIGQLETERLVLRPLQEADDEALQLIGTDDVFEMVPDIDTPFDASAWVTHKLKREVPTVGHAIVTKADNVLVGYVQITDSVAGEGYYLGVGYWLGQAHWGKGYATEAVRAALFSLQATVGEGQQLIPVHAKVIPENAASRRVLEKCDFVASDPPNGADDPAGMAWYHWPLSARRYRIRS